MVVTDTQLYLAIGMPVFAILIGIISNGLQMSAINARITSLEGTMNARFIALESRFDQRMSSLEARFDILVGKVIEIEHRIS
jgi:hypothetical protein